VIDIKLIREEPDRIKAELEARGIGIDFDRLVKLDEERRSYQAKIDESRAKQNTANQGIAAAEGAEKQTKITQMKELSDQVKQLETEKHTVDREFQKLYLILPNFHHHSVPIGKDETKNVVHKTVGEGRIPGQAGDDVQREGIGDGKETTKETPPQDQPRTRSGARDDARVKPHYEIPAIAPLIDAERGAKVSGSRFWYLKGELVELEFALIRYTLDFYKAKGYLPMRPPSLVRGEAMVGTGFFPADANEIYKIDEGREELLLTEDGEVTTQESSQPIVAQTEALFLSGTAEVALASYHASETLPTDDLPIKYIGFSPAYRREAGTYGKDTKGILRGHEFDKLELFQFAHPDKSWEIHEQMQADAEEFWSSLGIPFQVLLMCTGDIGAPNAKKYDLEAWLPGEGKYRELGSNSHDTDFQARRLKIHYGSEQKAAGLVHTLNNTAVAIGRAIIAITENYQREDGTVDMPTALHPYLPFKKIVEGD